MNSVQIEGPRDVLLGLVNIPGLQIFRHTATQIDADRWVVSAYATDDAIAQVEARGATVNIIMSAEELRQHQERVFRQIGSGEGEA